MQPTQHFHSHRSSVRFSPAAVVLCLFAGTHLIAQGGPPPTPTKTAVQNTSTSIPGGGFENTAITEWQYAPSWTGWTFSPAGLSGGSGIGKDGSRIVADSNPAPFGDYVAFIEGSAIAETVLSVSPGQYRIRFRSAQRIINGVVATQGLNVTANGVSILSTPIAGGVFRDYVSSIFTVVGSGSSNLTVRFTGTSPAGPFQAGLIDFVRTESALLWSADSTWSPMGAPGTSDDVLVGLGSTVALNNNNVARTVQVTGSLTADSTASRLTTDWLLVNGPRSSFTVGSQAQPFLGDFELRLAANMQSPPILGGGTKFLMAMNGGNVHLHGKSKTSWTRLQSIDGTSPSGADIVVDNAKGWGKGDEIVVAYTGYVSHLAPAPVQGNPNPYQGPKSQVRIIDTVDGDSGKITLLNTIVRADHCTATKNTITDLSGSRSWNVEQRAEVGMLSHNVRVVGINNTGGFGGHVMIMAGSPTRLPGYGTFSNVEFKHLGQRQELGRYPLHWHMQRDNGYGQFVRDSAVRETFNRAITIHGSHGIEVERNVCFDSEGHAVFLEDGVERNNRFIRNLVVATRKPPAGQEMLPHDNNLDQPQNRSPAAFWISHPTNEFIGNVAADSLGVGYWFALHLQPTGTSSKPEWVDSFSYSVGNPWNSTKEPLGAFVANLAHSCKNGIDIHDSVNPNGTLDNPLDDVVLTNVDWDPPSPTDLVDYRAYGCTEGIYTGASQDFNEDIRFVDCVLTDNGVHTQFASADSLIDSVVVYDNGNLIYPTPFNSLSNLHMIGYEAGHGHVIYDGPGRLKDCYFVGYDGVLRGSLFWGQFGAARRHTGHLVDGLTYAGGAGAVPNIVFQDLNNPNISLGQKSAGTWGIAVYDEFGCLSRGLFPDYTLISNHPMMRLLNGTPAPDVALGSNNAWLSPSHWGHLQQRYYAGSNWNILLQGQAPPASNPSPNPIPESYFRRQPYSGNSAIVMTEPFGGGQMRQIPVIIQQNATSTECVYEVRVIPNTTLPLHRVDLSLDDVAAGERARVLVTHDTLPNWTPTLYINDNPSTIHFNGTNSMAGIVNLPQVGALNGTTTGFAMVNVGTPQNPVMAIDLQLINPNRTHRISITW